MINFKNLDAIQETMVKLLLVDALTAKTEAGKMEDADFGLMNELGIAEDVETKAFQRAGDSDALMELIDPKIWKLAWEK